MWCTKVEKVTYCQLSVWRPGDDFHPQWTEPEKQRERGGINDWLTRTWTRPFLHLGSPPGKPAVTGCSVLAEQHHPSSSGGQPVCSHHGCPLVEPQGPDVFYLSWHCGQNVFHWIKPAAHFPSSLVKPLLNELKILIINIILQFPQLKKNGLKAWVGNWET